MAKPQIRFAQDAIKNRKHFMCNSDFIPKEEYMSGSIFKDYEVLENPTYAKTKLATVAISLIGATYMLLANLDTIVFYIVNFKS